MADQQPNQLELWNSVCETDPKFIKHVNQRGGFSAIDPTYQIKAATELWGSYGGSWGLTEPIWGMLEIPDQKPTMTLDAVFYYPGGAFPISADMPYRANDDCRKKLMTMCRSKAFALLGFNADVFLGQFEDEKYVSDMTAKYSDEDELRAKILGSIRKASSASVLDQCRARLDDLRGNGAINRTLYDEGLQLIEQQSQGFANGAPTLYEQDAIRQQELTT